MSEDPQCNALHKTAVLDDSIDAARDGSLANVFVYVKQGLEGKKFEPPAQPATIDQKGCWFIPRVLGIQTGQTLDVTKFRPGHRTTSTRARTSTANGIRARTRARSRWRAVS